MKLLGGLVFCGGRVLLRKIKNLEGELNSEMRNINKEIKDSIKTDDLVEFEDTIIYTFNVYDKIDNDKWYESFVKSKREVIDDCIDYLEDGLIDNITRRMMDKPFYLFYELYADPACPQVFKQLKVVDFFFLSCYIDYLMKKEGRSRTEVYSVLEELYHDSYPLFLRTVRDYGIPRND